MANHLYRMAIDGGLCPSGQKAKALLHDQNIDFEDHLLTTRAEVEAFKKKHGVATTPQIWLDDKHIGGFDDLKNLFTVEDQEKKASASYTPVIYLFFICALMALSCSYAAYQTPFTRMAIQWFIAFSMCILALQKLRDLSSFEAEFVTYDLLAMKWPFYGKIYPFAELTAGVLMVAGILHFISIPIALFIGIVGAYSVYKAVYLEKKQLSCACVGGESIVPLGFVSLTENIVMITMAIWMIFR